MFLTRWQEKFNNGDLDIFKSDRATCLFYQFLYFSSSNLDPSAGAAPLRFL